MLTQGYGVLLCAAALLTACATEQPREPAVTGDTILNDIVTKVARAQLVPELRLDAEAQDFSSVSRVYVGPQQQLLVPLPQDHQLRIYDETGTLSASVGRRGSGPGEFQSLATMGSVADSIWVFDIAQRRVTYMASDGTVLRTAAIPQRVLRDTLGGVVGHLLVFLPLAVYGDGSILGESRARPAAGSGNLTPRAVALMGPNEDAKVVFVPPSFEDPRWRLEVEGFGQPVPFTMSPQMSWSTDGRRLATLHADTVTQSGGTLQLRLYRVNDPRSASAQAATLRPTLERSFAYQGEPISQAAIDSALAAFIPEQGSPAEGPPGLPRRFQALARTRMPAVYPAVIRLRLGVDETIWFDLRPSRDGKMSLVLDELGTPIGTVVVPLNVTIAQSSRSHVWALERNEFGLASVIRYRVVGLK